MTKKGKNSTKIDFFCKQTQEQHETHLCAKFQAKWVTRTQFMAYLGQFQAYFDPRKQSFQSIFAGHFTQYLENYWEFLQLKKNQGKILYPIGTTCILYLGYGGPQNSEMLFRGLYFVVLFMKLVKSLFLFHRPILTKK